MDKKMKPRAGKTFEQKMYDINHGKNLPMTFNYLSKSGTQIRFETGKNNDPKNGWGFKLDKNGQSIPKRTIDKILKECHYKQISGGYDMNGNLNSTITIIEII